MKRIQGRTKRRGPLRRYAEDYLFILPYYLIFVVFTILPVGTAIGLSFTYFNVLEAPSFVGVSNYVQLVLDDSLFMTALKNTLFLSLITGPLGYLLSIALAWLVNEFGAKLRSVLTLLFYAPVISGGAYMIWQIIFSGDAYGMANGLLMQLGVINEPILWLTDPRYDLGIVIVVQLWLSLGTSFLAFIAGFQTIDASLYEAAAVDGIRTRWQELWYITLPCIKPQLMFSAIMSITSSFTIGDQITMLVGFPSPNYAAHTIMHHLQDYGSTRFEMGYACAIATVLFLLMVVCNTLIQKFLRKVGN